MLVRLATAVLPFVGLALVQAGVPYVDPDNGISLTDRAPASGQCAGIAAWSSTAIYVGGNRATYNDHLWTAQWWTEGDTPGGPTGVWADNGAC